MGKEAWVSIEGIARHLDVSVYTVYRCIAKRSMPASKTGPKWKFKISQVDAWAEVEDTQNRGGLK